MAKKPRRPPGRSLPGRSLPGRSLRGCLDARGTLLGETARPSIWRDADEAGYFDGGMLVKRYAEFIETGTPSAPHANHARLFVRDNGSGKTQLCVRFHTGAVRVLATQP